MAFSYTDDAVVSTSPTGRHLSTVIKRPCVLMSGWTEHAEAICKVLNEPQPDHPVSNVKVELDWSYGAQGAGYLKRAAEKATGDIYAVLAQDFNNLENRAADHYTKAYRHAVSVGSGAADLLCRVYVNELLADGDMLLGKCPQRRSTDEANATQASGIFVAQDGTVRAETKQRGVHWRGKIPADKTLALLSWAGKGPHTVEQVRQKCEELSAVVEPVIRLSASEVLSGYDRVKWAEGLIRQLPETHDGRNSWLLNYGTGAPPSAGMPGPVPPELQSWKDYGQRIYAHALEQGKVRDALVAEVAELKAALKAPIEVSTSLARSLLNTTPGVLIHSVNNARPPFKRVDA